jgi:hypothetical protein
MAALIMLFLVVLMLTVGAAAWILWALVAAIRGKGPVWLYAGAPVALVVCFFAAQKLVFMVIVFVVAAANGGTGGP